MKLEVFNKLADRLEAIASKFSDANTEEVSTNEEEVTEAMAEETATEEAEQSFAEAVLVDGTVVSYEGELAPGTAVFIVAEEGDQIPAPEGTHALGGEMEGVSIVVDAEGVITEVVDEREGGEAAEAPAEEEMSEEVNIEEIIDEKMSELSTPIEKIVDGLESLMNENNSLKSELAELRSEFAAFKNEPSEIEEKSKFSRAEKMSRRERYLYNLRKNK